jgi:dTDP-4-amino-4,6-dideoxygalactose transaminase
MDASEAAHIQALLTSRNIGFRLWYCTGTHRHPYYANLPREKSLSVTEYIAPLLLDLPSAHNLTESQLDRVVEALALAIKP